MRKVKLSKEEIKKLKNMKEFRAKDISLKDIKIEPGRISILRVKGEGGMEGEGRIIMDKMDKMLKDKRTSDKNKLKIMTLMAKSLDWDKIIEDDEWPVKDIPLGSFLPCACGCGKFILLKKRTHRFFDGACRIRYWRNKRKVVVAGPAKPGEIVRRLHRKAKGYIKEKKA